LVIVINNTFSLIRATKVKLRIGPLIIKLLFCAVLCGLAAWSSFGLLDMLMRFGDYSGRFNGSTLALALASTFSVIVYFLSLFLSNVISKNDILMLPKGEKISKVLEKYRLIG
jgi:stage V sporulation protein B